MTIAAPTPARNTPTYFFIDDGFVIVREHDDDEPIDTQPTDTAKESNT